MNTIYIVNAFSMQNKGGNPAGIVLNATQLSNQEKQEIATKVNLSETVFLTESAVADYKLEYFTPKGEVDLCGHATIATFSLLYLQNKLHKKHYTIETKAGILEIDIQEDGLVLMEQNLPVYSEQLSKEEFVPILPISAIDTNLPIQIVSTGLRDILLPIKSEIELANIKPDFDAMAKLSNQYNTIGVHAFTIKHQNTCTAICRNFAPLYGIDEESATGTSNCALACYLYHYGIEADTYIFEQGYHLNAPSRIIVHIANDQHKITKVQVGGYGYLVKTSQYQSYH